MSESPGRSELPFPEPAPPTGAEPQILLVKRLGIRDYLDTWKAMRAFTDSRVATSQDELWLLEHPPIFTLGQAGRREHILDAGEIPVLQVDRGGQVTYHGPGQLIAYVLLDLGRAHLGIKALVHLLEAAVIDLLVDLGIDAEARPQHPDNPGGYRNPTRRWRLPLHRSGIRSGAGNDVRRTRRRGL